MSQNPVILAFDFDDINTAISFARPVSPYIGYAKLGLEFFCKYGAEGVKKFKAETGLKIFLDLKLHDIPNTVSSSLKQLLKIGVDMATIHCLNGAETLATSAEVVKNESPETLLLGVTILTSHASISEIGIENSIENQVLLLAKLAAKSGLGGVVCSGHEITPIKNQLANSLKLVVPGIRTETDSAGDQSRILTPQKAYQLGANYLVIGRPITKSHNPEKKAQEILQSLNLS